MIVTQNYTLDVIKSDFDKTKSLLRNYFCANPFVINPIRLICTNIPIGIFSKPKSTIIIIIVLIIALFDLKQDDDANDVRYVPKSKRRWDYRLTASLAQNWTNL